jgi:hypothetical protein
MKRLLSLPAVNRRGFLEVRVTIMPDRTFDEVIEAHREEIGATRVRVMLGPEATPDGLASALAELRRTGAVYTSFSELERERAKVHRLHGVLGRVSGLTTTPFDGLSSEEVQSRMSEIFSLTDLVPDVDLEGDIDWMRAERERRGEALPPDPA